MRFLLLFATLLVLSPALVASERLREAAFPEQINWQEVTLERKNQDVLTYLWADVYAAAYYAPVQSSPNQSFNTAINQRLELYYFRNIKREDVIKAAWVTLERQHSQEVLARLRPELNALHQRFRDIRPGDRYALNFHAEQGLSLEINDQIAFSSKDTELASAYLGIWLAPEGLSDKLRNNLLASSD
jgi:hypothetical protein